MKKILVFENNQKEQKRQKHIEALQKEAEPYETEIQEIRADLESKYSAIYSSSDSSGVMTGFVLTSAKDLELVKKVTEQYNFTPVIVLDCALPQDTLTEILQKASEEKYEIMLSGMTFDEDVLRMADSVREEGTEYGYSQDMAFMIRRDCDSEENRSLLEQHGYRDIICFDNSMKSEISGEMRYLPYWFVRSKVSAYTNAIEYAISEKADMIWLFNLAETESGELSEEIITDFLKILNTRVTEGTMHCIKLTDAFYILAEKEGLTQDAEEEYAQYKEEQEKRISELEEKVDEIYSHWNEY